MAAAALFGVGCAALALVWLGQRAESERFAEPPEASGEIGVVYVYAQLPSPTLITPVSDRGPRRAPYALPRPHDLAFQLHVDGLGPRHVRIEMDHDGARSVLYENTFEAPKNQWALEYVLTLGDSAPDIFDLVITVEAPHRAPNTVKYPIKLVVASTASP